MGTGMSNFFISVDTGGLLYNPLRKKTKRNPHYEF